MSKLSSPKEIAESLEVKIQRHKLNSSDMAEFVKYVQEQKEIDPSVKVSLKDYVQEKFYSGKKNIVVVPDFSGVTVGETISYDAEALKDAFELDRSAGMSEPDQQDETDFLKNMKEVIDAKREENLDLSGVDFTGCRMEGARFESCDLTGVDARDADLSGVVLHDCVAKEMDFRGSNISGLEFSEIDLGEVLYDNYVGIKPISESVLLEHKNDNVYVDMHFSTAESMLHRYRDENERLEEAAEEKFNEKIEEALEQKREELAAAEKRVSDAYAKVSYWQLARGGSEYDQYAEINRIEAPKIEKLKAEISELAEQEFGEEERKKIKYVVHPSVIGNLLMVSDSVRNKYDPAYRRGSSQEKGQDKTQYVRLSREDAESYLKACESNPDLSINEFAKGLMQSKGIEAVVGAKVVADFSVHIDETQDNPLYAGVVTDLSGLDFSKRDLRGACFVGANLQDCKFNNAKLDQATLEGADASRADFTGVSAKDTNLQATKIQSAVIENADFSRAYMPHARVHDLERDEVSGDIGTPEKLRVAKSKFDFADLSNANLDGARIEDSTFDYAELSGVSLANADIQRCKMRHANLERAILNNCKIIETDLSGSILRQAESKKATFKETVLENVDARSMDLSESEIDELCKLSGAKLEKAIMRKVKADRVNFVGANMKQANLQYAQLKGAIVEGVDMQFSNLERAVADGIKASGADMTGANLTDISARGAEFKEAQLEGIKAHRAELSEAVLEGANLRGAKMHKAILEKVNLKKADLRNAEMERANLKKANVEEAQINDGTDLHHAEAEEISGSFEHEAEDGSRTKMKPEVKIEQDNKAYDAKKRTFLGKFGARVAGVVGGVAKKVGAFIKQPLSAKWGRIIGAVIGVAIAATIIATTVLTAGLSIPVMAAVAAGTVLACGGAGVVAGHFAAKHSGLSTFAGAGAGFAFAGPVGAGLGAAGVAAANSASKQAFGTTVDRAVGGAFEGAGEYGVKHAKNVREGEEFAQAQKRSNEAYKAPKKPSVSQEEEIDRTGESLDREAVKARSKKADLSKSPSQTQPNRKKSSSQSKTHDQLEREARDVGKSLGDKRSTEVTGERAVMNKKKPIGRERR